MDHLYFTVQYKSHYRGIRSHYSPVEHVAAWMHKFLKFFRVTRKARSSREISRSDRTTNVDFSLALAGPLGSFHLFYLSVLFDGNVIYFLAACTLQFHKRVHRIGGDIFKLAYVWNWISCIDNILRFAGEKKKK